MCDSCRCDEILGFATIIGAMRHLDFNNYRFDESLGCATVAHPSVSSHLQ